MSHSSHSFFCSNLISSMACSKILYFISGMIIPKLAITAVITEDSINSYTIAIMI